MSDQQSISDSFVAVCYVPDLILGRSIWCTNNRLPLLEFHPVINFKVFRNWSILSKLSWMHMDLSGQTNRTNKKKLGSNIPRSFKLSPLTLHAFVMTVVALGRGVYVVSTTFQGLCSKASSVWVDMLRSGHLLLPLGAGGEMRSLLCCCCVGGQGMSQVWCATTLPPSHSCELW